MRVGDGRVVLVNGNQPGCAYSGCAFDMDSCKMVNLTAVVPDAQALLNQNQIGGGGGGGGGGGVAAGAGGGGIGVGAGAGAGVTLPVCREVDARRWLALRCNLNNKESGRSAQLCLIQGPIVQNSSDYRQKVVLDAYENYKGLPGHVWDQLNCTVKELQKDQSEFRQFRVSDNPIQLIFVRDAVTGAMLLMAAKELFKVLVLVLGMCVPHFRKPQWFIITMNSPLVMLFMLSERYRRLAAVSRGLILPSARVFLDLFLDDGLQIAITVYIQYLTWRHHPNMAIDVTVIITLAGNLLSAFYALFIFILGVCLGCRRNVDPARVAFLKSKLSDV